MPRTGAFLVTGGAGFIGSHLVQALLDDGATVRVVDNFCTGNPGNLLPFRSRIEFIEGDLADAEVAKAACRGIDGVFHQAAIPSVPRSFAQPLPTQHSGELATLQLLEACCLHKVSRIVFASSSSVYGNRTDLPANESMLPRPLSPYAASKLACESYIRAYSQTKGLDGISLRYFNVFGSRQDPASPYSGAIPLFMDRMKSGKSPHIYGDGEQSRDFTYVANVVDANLRAMGAQSEFGGAACNVGCGQSITLNELVRALNEILGTAVAPTYGDSRPGDVRHSLADISLAGELIGYKPVVSWLEGLRKLAGCR